MFLDRPGGRWPRLRLRRATIAISLCLTVVVPARAGLVLNEILPDPDGSDGGREFVEILNTGSQTISLDGVCLQFANGAVAALWETRWSAPPGLWLAAGERFLITDRNWLGAATADAEVWLGLQNGPDAVRLLTGQEVTDLVGYGALTDPDLMENTPVPLVAGKSLARRPDGRDTQDNGADLVPAVPTPGAQNFLARSLALIGLSVEPPAVDRPAIPVTVVVTLLNDGIETLPAGPLTLTWGFQRVIGRLTECPADGLRTVTWFFEPQQTGQMPLSVSYQSPSEEDSLVVALGSFQAGPGPLVLNEVVPAPGNGQGEWIELMAGSETVDLGDYRLRDEGSDWRALPPEFLNPGERVVLAQDAAALQGWIDQNIAHGAPAGCPDASIVRLRELAGGWPTLNNSASDDGPWADRVLLADSAGTVLDHLAWGGSDPGTVPLPSDGVSLERQAWAPPNPIAANWTASTALAGATPGCSNSVSLEGAADGPLELIPRILDAAAAGVVHLRFALEYPATGWELRIYDLWGGLVRDLGGEARGPGPRDLLWDGRDDAGRPVSAGGYVVLLVVRDISGRTLNRSRALLAVRRRA